MLYALKKIKTRFLYLEKFFLIVLFVILSNSAFANTCEVRAFAKRITNNEITQIKGEEFSHFHRKPGRYVLYKMNLKNRWLGIRESRPDMYNEEAYTTWLIGKQREGQVPDNPYGYHIRERLELVASFTYHAHHEVVPRIAPAWIPNDKLLKHDPNTVQRYKDWAEAYYLESRFYPPGYLQYVKNSLDRQFFEGVSTGFGSDGFKDDRRLKDVIYSLGGRPLADNGDKKGSSTLIDLIRELTDQDRWLDGGTGSGFVLQDALKGISKERGAENVPNVLGITYNERKPEHFDSTIMPEGFLFSSISYPVRLPEELMGKYEVWDGRLFQDIPIYQLMPKFKLITDFFGIYTYSSDPAAVINKYLSIMSLEGTIGIVYVNRYFVKTAENGTMFLHEWLASLAIRGLFVEYGIGWLNSPRKKVAYMLIRKTSEGQIEIPNLTIVENDSAQRVFRPIIDIGDAF